MHICKIVRERDDLILEEIEVQADPGIPFNGPWTITNFDQGVNFRTHAAFNHTPGIEQDLNTGQISSVNPQNYKAIEINIGDRQVDDVWNILLQVQTQMQNAQFNAAQNGIQLYDYDIAYNSNTYVNTLLSVVGIDLSAQLLDQVRLPPIPTSNIFPGAGRNAFTDPKNPLDAINLNLVGSARTDYIFTGLGNDIINGGAGNDTLRGDAGADRFVFDIGTFRDRVIDYDDAEDMLDFSDFGFSDVADALSNAANVSGDVLFTIGADQITIENTTIAEITDNIII